ncbi:MAG: oligopeptide/dipeptide ABC transporter ATP-binding protein, partial [Acetobacteraceae bacterium]
PYTLGLIGSAPQTGAPQTGAPRGRLLAIEGTVPTPADMPAGCRFHPRCALAEPACVAAPPLLRAFGRGHRAACRRAPVDALAAAGA